MDQPLLSVRDCSFGYADGGFHLRRVSLDVRRGEVVGIVGPNGSGKTTLLRIMGGLLRPSEGEVRLEGKSVAAIGRRRLAQTLAFLPQSPEASFRFTVREVVAMGRYPHQSAFGFATDRDIEVVERALAEAAASRLADRSFFTLSGGEKQSVLIASILAQEPAVMLLDEPTSALDIHHASEVLDLLWGLSRRNIAVVTVTHDLNAAGQFCDRLVLLSDGQIARAGPPSEVIESALLSDVYGVGVSVFENPVTATPMAFVKGKRAHEKP